MIAFIKLMGLVCIGMGVYIFFRSVALKKMIAYIKQGKRMYWSAGLKFAFGIILLLVADQCRYVGIIKFFGVLYVVGPAVFFVLGRDKMEAYCDWWEKRPASIVRLWCVLAIMVGLLFLYAA